MGEFGKTATEIASAFGDEAEKRLEQVLRRRLESHDADKLAFSSFHHSLSELASGLSCQASEASGADRSKGIIVPLVFIIDELDRCKPSFALEVLEKIKHFFFVPGVSFMIVCSVEHLVASVRYAYGNIDALMYLEKFYHIRILFPSANCTTRDMVATTYLRHLECGGTAADIIDQYSRYNPLSLRSLERVVLYLKLARASLPENGRLMDTVVAVLCILKVVYPEEYSLIRRQQLPYELLQERIRFDLWRSMYDLAEKTPLAERTQSIWRYLLRSSEDDGSNGQPVSQLFDYGLGRENTFPFYCGLIDGFSFPDL